MLSNIDFVDDDIRSQFEAKARNMREYYGIHESQSGGPIWTVSSSVNPIERIRLQTNPSWKHTGIDKHVLTAEYTQNGEYLVGVAIGNRIFIGTNQILVGDEKIKIKFFKILNNNFILIVIEDAGQDRVLLMNSETSRIVSDHSLLGKQITGIHRISGEFRFVLSTNDGAIYFLSAEFTSSGIAINHQLVIAGNSASLGGIACISFSWKYNLLAILAEKSLVILRILESSKIAPKVVIKINGIKTTIDGRCWWTRDGLLVKTRSSEWIFLERFTSPGSSDEFIFEQRICLANSDDDMYFFSEHDTVGLLATGKEDDKTISLFEIEKNGEKYAINFFQNFLSHKLSSESGICERLLIDNTDGPKGSSDLSIRSISISPSTGVNVYSIKISTWTEIIESLMYAERFIEVMDLLERIRVGSVPLAGSLHGWDLTRLVRGAWNSHKKLIFLFLYLQKKMEFLEDVFGDDDMDGLRILIDMLTTSQLPDTLRIPSFIFQKILSHLTGKMQSGDGTAKSQLDRLIVTTIWQTITTTGAHLPIDLNSAIRVATIHDLERSVILMHIYLLNDFEFAIKYLLGSDDFYFYAFTILNGLTYPFWIPFSGYDSIVGRDAVWNMISGKGSEKFLPDKTRLALNSIVFDYDFGRQNLSQMPTVDAVMYCIKSALFTGRLTDFLNKNSANLTHQNIIQFILNQENKNSKIFLELFNQIGSNSGPPPMELVHSIVTSQTASLEVLVSLFNEKFSPSLGIEKTISILLSKNRIDVALLVLEHRRAFPWLTELLLGLQHEEGIEEILHVMKGITARSGEYFDPESLVKIWVHILDSRDDLVHASDEWLNKVDVVSLAKTVSRMTVVSKLTRYMKNRQVILSNTMTLSGNEVGTQFNDLVGRKDKGMGMSSTSTICHSCLDPLLGASNKSICFFSCGHLVHRRCCEFSKPLSATMSVKCPVCG